MAPRHRVYKMIPNEVECICWMKMAIELKITFQRRDVATKIAAKRQLQNKSRVGMEPGVSVLTRTLLESALLTYGARI